MELGRKGDEKRPSHPVVVIEELDPLLKTKLDAEGYTITKRQKTGDVFLILTYLKAKRSKIIRSVKPRSQIKIRKSIEKSKLIYIKDSVDYQVSVSSNRISFGYLFGGNAEGA